MATLPSKNALADLTGGYYSYWTDGTTEGRATLAVILGSTDAQAAAASFSSLALGTALPATSGGTGLTSISTLLNSNVTPTTLGLVIGTNVQAWSTNLDALALDPLTATTAASTYQPLDSDLTAIAALDPSANNLIYKSGGSTWSTASITTFGRSLIDDPNAATARTTLGVDAAGTDNSTDVTIAAGLDYVTITGQVLTLGQIDLTTDVTGALPDGNIATATSWNTAYSHSQITTGNPHSVTKSDVGLGNVENTALSTWAGSANVTTLGTIATGVWQGTAIASTYIGSHTHAASDVTSGTFADALISESSVTQHVAEINHDSLLGFVANEHIDWTSASANFSTTGTFASGSATVTGVLQIGSNLPSFNEQFYSTKTGSATSITVYANHIYEQDTANSNRVSGLRSRMIATHTTGTMADLIALRGEAVLNGAGDVTLATALWLDVQESSSGTIAEARGIQFDAFGGSITTKWSIYDESGGEAYFGTGVRIGTTSGGSARLTLAASTTSIASLNIPSGTAPTSPTNGDIWSDGSDLLVRLGGTTYTLQKS